jgi:hypothetical protein
MFILDYEQPRCESCRWWMSDGSSGECHRYPPNPEQFRPNPNGHGLDWVNAHWPETKEKDFCGEHQPIPKGAV